MSREIFGAIKEFVEDAVAAERERCAKIAENWGKTAPNPVGTRAALAAAIRAAVREGGGS